MAGVYEELFCLCSFAITGIVIGILFDCFRILRKSFKTADFITYIQDILFWILAGIIVLFAIFKFNHGEIRSYVFLGISLGILIYMITISKFVIKYSVFVVMWVKKVVSYPIQLAYKFFKAIMIKPIYNFLQKIKKNQNNKTKNVKKIKKNLQEKRGILWKM